KRNPAARWQPSWKPRPGLGLSAVVWPSDRADMADSSWRSAVCRPILDCMEFLRDLVSELLSWFTDVLGPVGEHLVHRQTGHALARGRVECSLKVTSGLQPGLSPRWRKGVVAISPGRLEFTPESGRPRATGPITHVVVLGPGRPLSREELTWLPADCQ